MNNYAQNWIRLGSLVDTLIEEEVKAVRAERRARQAP